MRFLGDNVESGGRGRTAGGATDRTYIYSTVHTPPSATSMYAARSRCGALASQRAGGTPSLYPLPVEGREGKLAAHHRRRSPLPPPPRLAARRSPAVVLPRYVRSPGSTHSRRLTRNAPRFRPTRRLSHACPAGLVIHPLVAMPVEGGRHRHRTRQQPTGSDVAGSSHWSAEQSKRTLATCCLASCQLQYARLCQPLAPTLRRMAGAATWLSDSLKSRRRVPHASYPPPPTQLDHAAAAVGDDLDPRVRPPPLWSCASLKKWTCSTGRAVWV